MKSKSSLENYHKSLIYLGHLFTMADGVRDDMERDVLKTMRIVEEIEDRLYNTLNEEIAESNDRQILKKGIYNLQQCERDEILKAFGWLFRILDADDCLKVNEIRMMLFVLGYFDISFHQVIKESKKLPTVKKK